jgi:hypothetical protein
MSAGAQECDALADQGVGEMPSLRDVAAQALENVGGRFVFDSLRGRLQTAVVCAVDRLTHETPACLFRAEPGDEGSIDLQFSER